MLEVHPYCNNLLVIKICPDQLIYKKRKLYIWPLSGAVTQIWICCHETLEQDNSACTETFVSSGPLVWAWLSWSKAPNACRWEHSEETLWYWWLCAYSLKLEESPRLLSKGTFWAASVSSECWSTQILILSGDSLPDAWVGSHFSSCPSHRNFSVIWKPLFGLLLTMSSTMMALTLPTSCWHDLMKDDWELQWFLWETGSP